MKKKLRESLGKETIQQKREKVNKIDKNLNEIIAVIDNYDNLTDEISVKIVNINSDNENINNELNNKTTELNSKINEYNKLKSKYEELTTFIIKNVITFNQYPKYPNGCEAVALYILLRYYNINVNIDSVMDTLPKGKVPYDVDGVLYGGDPNYEFLGDPRLSSGWGIYDKGLAETANNYKANIINGTGMDFSKVLGLVKENRPVVVWTSINLANSYISKTWISDKTGEIIKWKKGNHAVVVIGYNDSSIIVSDPIDGKIKYFNKQKFIDMYNYMGRRALYY